MIRENKSWKMRCVGRVVTVRRMRDMCDIWLGNLNGIDLTEDLGIDGWII
jgi:hypothetical protein